MIRIRSPSTFGSIPKAWKEVTTAMPYKKANGDSVAWLCRGRPDEFGY